MTHGGARKGAGRKKGQTNKRTREIGEKLDELGCDPIEGMARIAQTAMDSGDLALAGSMYKELAQYILPKRKAIEHTGEGGGPIKTSSAITFVGVGKDAD